MVFHTVMVTHTGDILTTAGVTLLTMGIIGQVITMAIGMVFMPVVVTILDILEEVITLIMVKQYLISQEEEELVGVQSQDQILEDLPHMVSRHQVQIIVVILP